MEMPKVTERKTVICAMCGLVIPVGAKYHVVRSPAGGRRCFCVQCVPVKK